VHEILQVATGAPGKVAVVAGDQVNIPGQHRVLALKAFDGQLCATFDFKAQGG
jgi:hypothetical protein